MNNLSTIEPVVRPATSRARRPHRGFTIIELMIVIAILVAVSVASIPVLNQSTSNRVLRESARTVAEMLATARTRAITTGRATGVWFEPLLDPDSGTKSGASQSLYFCEQLAPYSGDTPNAYVKIVSNGMGDASTSTTTPVAKVFFVPSIEATLKQLGILTNVAEPVLQGGPYYIRIGGSGPYYKLENQGSLAAQVFYTNVSGKRVCTISNPAQTPAAGGALPVGTIVQLPKPTAPALLLLDNVAGMQFQIIRGAVKTPDAPLQLPAPACVDITQSGMTSIGSTTSGTTTVAAAAETIFTVPWFNSTVSTMWPIGADAPSPVGIPQTPLIVWFGPSGSLQKVYWSIPNGAGNSYYNVRPSEFLHFLIGRRELVMPNASISAASLIDGNLGRPTRTDRTVPEAASGPTTSMWVTVGAKTGLVTVAENVDPTNKITAANSPDALTATKFELGTARSSARAQQATGGR